jgi:hypothetical protein
MTMMFDDNVRRLRRPESDQAAPGRRWKTNWPAELAVPQGRIACTVFDISSWGARLGVETKARLPDQVSLIIDNIGTIAAKVVWQQADSLGLQFTEQQPWIRRLHAQHLDPTTWPSTAGA